MEVVPVMPEGVREGRDGVGGGRGVGMVAGMTEEVWQGRQAHCYDYCRNNDKQGDNSSAVTTAQEFN